MKREAFAGILQQLEPRRLPLMISGRTRREDLDPTDEWQ